MKRRILFFTVLLVLCSCMMLLAACGDGNTSIDGKDDPIIDNVIGDEGKVVFSVMVDDGVSVTTSSREKDSSMTVVAPAVDGKLFLAWYMEGEKVSDEAEFTFTVVGDCALRAEYVDTHTVHLDAGEGEVEVSSVTVGQGLSFALPIAVRRHFIFLGWEWGGRLITDDEGISVENFSLGRDVTLNAKYQEKNKYSVKISNGEVELEPEIYYEDEVIELTAEDLSDIGKKMVGWYLVTESDDGVEETLVSSNDVFSFTVKGNVEYVAKYEIAYKIEVTFGTLISIMEFGQGETVDINYTEDPIGKQFSHWKDGAGNIVSTERNFSFEATQSLVLDAVFTDILYKLTYILDGGTPIVEEYKYNQAVSMWSPDKVAHKKFSGWSQDIRKMPAEDVTVTGSMLWEKHILTVIDGQGGGKFDYGTEVTLTPNTYTGKHFVNWTIDDNTVTEPNYTFTLTKDTVVTGSYAWTDYKLEYVVIGADYAPYCDFANGAGEIYKSVTEVHCGDTVTLEGAPILVGQNKGHFDFSGWVDEESLGEYADEESFYTQVNAAEKLRATMIMPDKDVTIVAVFNVHRYTLEVVNGTIGDTEESVITVDWNTPVTVKATVPIGKRFIRWEVNEYGISQDIEYTYTVDGDTVLTANVEDKIYTVRYNLTDVDGSTTEYAVRTGKYDTDFPLPDSTPGEANKRFSGWTLDGGPLPAKVFDSDVDIVVQGYFSWTQITVRVEQGNVNGQGSEVTVDYNTEVTVNAVYAEPSNADWYQFSLWREVSATGSSVVAEAGSTYTFNATQDITLRSEFVKRTFTATFYVYDDGAIENGVYVFSPTEPTEYKKVSFDFDKKLTSNVLTAETSRPHYTFDGWKADRDGTSLPTTLSPADIDIYGEYKVVSYEIKTQVYNTEKNPVTEEIIDTKVLPYGTKVTLTAPDRVGETFVAWDKESDTNKSITHIVAGDYTAIAVYRRARHTVTVPSGTAVSIKEVAQQGDRLLGEENGAGDTKVYTYFYNTVVSLTPPEPPTGQMFSYWTKNTIEYSTDAILLVTVIDNGAYEAIYEKVDCSIYYHVEGTVLDEEGEIVTTLYKTDNYAFSDSTAYPNPQTGKYGEGIELYPIPIVPSYQTFDGWYIDAEYKTKLGTTVTPSAKRVDLYGRIVVKEYDLNLIYLNEEGENIIASSRIESKEYGKVTLTADIIEGQRFSKWVFNGTEYTDGTVNIVLKEHDSIEVHYTYVDYTLTYKTYLATSVDGEAELSEEEIYKSFSGLHYTGDSAKDALTLEGAPSEKKDHVFDKWTYEDGTEVGDTFYTTASDIVIVGYYMNKYEYAYLSESDSYSIKANMDLIGHFDADLVIPSTYGGKAVTSIEQYGFSSGNLSSTSLTIPDSVTYVGTGAFLYTSIESLTVSAIYGGYIGYLFGEESATSQSIPVGLKTVIANGCDIPDYAFYGCSGIENVTLNGITSVGANAFYGCIGIKELSLPETVRSIGIGAFEAMTGVTTFVYAVPYYDGMETNVYADFGNKVDVTVKASAVKIPDDFMSGNDLKSLTIEEGITDIGVGSFFAVNIDIITIPSTVERIGTNAFMAVPATEINFLAVECTVEEYAFSSVGNNATLTIGSGVKSITDGAFADTSLSTVTIESTVLTAIGNDTFKNAGVTSANIPDGVVSIGDDAFYGANLTEITIPAGISTIGNNAFANISTALTVNYNAVDATATAVFTGSNVTTVNVGDTAVNLPNGLFNGLGTVETVGFAPNGACTTVGSYAFYGNALTSVSLGYNITAIGEYAFANNDCSEIIIPYSVKDIGNMAFGYDDSSTATIYCEAEADTYAWHADWAKNAGSVVYGYGKQTDASGIEYILSGDGVVADGERKAYVTEYVGAGTDVTIPATLDGVAVYGFGNVFAGNTDITSVTVESEGIVSVVDGAFANCISLENVSIAGAPVMGEGIFSGCVALSSVNESCFGGVLPANTFYGCTSLADFDLSAFTSIGDNAFYGSGLTFADLTSLSDGTSLGSNVFADCADLIGFSTGDNLYFSNDGGALVSEDVIIAYPAASAATVYTVSEGITYIGDNAFKGAVNLTSITIATTVNYIGTGAFDGCINLATFNYDAVAVTGNAEEKFVGAGSNVTGGMTINIGNEVGTIPNGFFRSADINMGSLNFSEGAVLTTVGSEAFYGNRFEEVTVPATVTAIGRDAFAGSSIAVLNYDATSIDSVERGTFGDMANGATVNIGEGVVRIPTNLSYGTNVSVLNLPTGELEIGSYSFYGTQLTTLTVNNNVTDIESYAFAEIATLLSVSVNVEDGEGADKDYSGLSTIFSNSGTASISYAFGKVVPNEILKNGRAATVTINSAERIGDYALYGLNLNEITLPDTLTAIGAYGLGENNFSSINIPTALVYMGEGAFYGCDSLASVEYDAIALGDMNAENGVYGTDSIDNVSDIAVTIGAGVVSIPVAAFYSDVANTRIKSVTFAEPSALNAIGAYAFAGLTESTFSYNATSDIPDGVTSIGEFAFYRCELLTKVTVGALTALGDSAFYGCTALETFSATAGAEGYSLGNGAFEGCAKMITVDLGNAVAIGERAFFGCADMETIVGINDEITTIGTSAFEGCAKVSSVNIGKVTVFNDRVFYGCSSLVLSLPDTATYIGNEAFYGCTSMTEINIGEEVTTLGKLAFGQNSGVTSIDYKAKSLTPALLNGAEQPWETLQPFAGVGTATAGATLRVGEKVSTVYPHMFRNSVSEPINITTLSIAGRSDNSTLAIKDYAFESLPLTGDIVIDACVYEIGRYAFGSTTATGLVLGDMESNSLYLIGDRAFAYMANLEKIDYNADKLYEHLFVGSTSGISKYPSMDVFANSGIESGVTLTIGKNVKTIYKNTFNNVSAAENIRNLSIKELVFETDSTLTEIQSSAFYNNSTLTAIDFPVSLKKIGSEAFAKNAIKNVDIPMSVREIGDGAFAEMNGVESINVNFIGGDDLKISTNIFADIVPLNDGGITLEVGSYSDFIPCIFLSDVSENKVDIRSVLFAAGTKYITVANEAFADMTTITTLDTNGRVFASVGNRAFRNVSASFDATFCGMSRVVTIPDSVETSTVQEEADIGQEAFYNSGITKIYVMSNSIINIGNSAFENCTSLGTIDIVGMDEYVTPGLNGYGSGSLVYVSANTWSVETDVLIKNIGNRAFKNCTSFNFTEVYPAPESIGEEAFYGCTSLTSIFDLSNRALTIAGDELDGYEVVYGEGYNPIAYVGKDAFYGTRINRVVTRFKFTDSEMPPQHYFAWVEKTVEEGTVTVDGTALSVGWNNGSNFIPNEEKVEGDGKIGFIIKEPEPEITE